MTENKRLKYLPYFCAYTGLFLLMVGIVWFYFIQNNLSMVLGGDPVDQHLKALIYYGRWLRECAHRIFVEHSLDLPGYSMSLGLGSDIAATLHYYAIGEPLNVLAAFVPDARMADLYSVLIFVRMYLAGLAFSWFCFYTGRKNEMGVLAGALVYVFSGYSIYAGGRHPFFLTPMIFLPLVLMGAEKVMNERRHVFMVVSVALMALSNFYFFYMIAIFTVGYALLRTVKVNGLKAVRKHLCNIGHLALAAIIGVLLSAALFLPVVLMVLTNPRIAGGFKYEYRFLLDYYKRLPGAFVAFEGPGSWTYLGFSGAAVVLVLFLLMRRKQYGQYKLAFWILTICLMIPSFSYVMNGLTNVANRWTWAFAMLAGYIAALVWEEFLTIRRGEAVGIGLVLALLLLLSATELYAPLHLNTQIEVLLGALMLLVGVIASVAKHRYATKLKNNNQQGSAEPHKTCVPAQLVMLLLVFAGLCTNGLNALLPSLGGFAGGYKSQDQVIGSDSIFFDTEAAAVRKISDMNVGANNLWTRYTGRELNGNAASLAGVGSTQFYFSLANGYVAQFFTEMAVKNCYTFAYEGFDDRTILNEIACVNYDYTEDPQYVPYGYEEVPAEMNEVQAKYPIYENQYALPFGYTCDQWIDRASYEALKPYEREQLLMHAAVLEEAPFPEKEAEWSQNVLRDITSAEGTDGTAYTDGVETLKTIEELPFEIIAEDGKVEITEHSLKALEDEASVRIKFKGIPGTETALYIENLDFAYDETVFSELPLKTRIKKVLLCEYMEKPNRLNLKLRAYTKKKKGTLKRLNFFTEKEKNYAGRHTFLFNSGYNDKAVTSFVLTLPTKGIYSFDCLSVIARHFEAYEQAAADLAKEHLTDADFHLTEQTYATNCITGTVTVETDKVMIIPLAYSDGWSAKVDDEKVKVLRADTMFMALAIPAGTHEICLTYTTPGGNAGAAASLIGILLLGAMIVAERRRKPMDLERSIL